MSFHPHLHCILSAGGWEDTKQQWIEPKRLNSGFFIPQNVMAACFKKHFLYEFSRLRNDAKLALPKELMHLNDPDQFRHFYNQIAFKKNWVVKIMPPLDNPKNVIDYLGRYIYRIAITDNRIREIQAERRKVIFQYKDYAEKTVPGQSPPLKEMTLDAIEFIRRFAQHVLPKGFQKARYWGIYGTACRKKTLSKIGEKVGKPTWNKIIRSVFQIIMAATGQNPNVCPCCGEEKLISFPILPKREFATINNGNYRSLRAPPNLQKI